MAKHRAPVDDLRNREEWAGAAAYRQANGSARRACQQRFPYPPQASARPSVVGVARVPATSRLTPPDRQLRTEPTGAISPVGPALTSRPAGRHRRVGEYGC
ncbi:hypothetical protein Vqi01_27650 [Micromonospora qiuiae]|uniref:Uncharacterized protein n=1 Tax=Micromonospora qiuiae TaxID=502268 RepID=A0ABQ4JBX5_9ACTN|nr:hypothetical protein Vqi01_27650 [Micromonospora qiuiae]